MKLRLLFTAIISGLLLFVMLVGVLILGQAAEAQPVEAAAIPQASIGPGSVTITGPIISTINVSTTFVATVVPTDTTQPISYTWEATGQAPVGHVGGLTDTVSFAWPVSGTQVVTVTAENSWESVTDTFSILISDIPALDVAVVFDVSGSMAYETNCFGCWTEGRPDLGLSNPDALLYPFPLNGIFNSLRYPEDSSVVPAWGGGSPPGDLSSAGDPVCGAAAGFVDSPPYLYSVYEAELYSDTGIGNISVSQPWRFDQRQAGQGFWVLQRPAPGVEASNDAFMRAHALVTHNQRDLSDIPRLQGGAYNSECFSGSELSGACWAATGAALSPPETAPSTPPWLEYDFTVGWSEPTHIWVRAIGGNGWSETWSGAIKTNNDDWRKALYYQVIDYSVDPPVKGAVGGGPLDGLLNQRGENIYFLEPGLTTDFPPGDTDRWRWVRLTGDTGLNLPMGARRTLRIYQGSTALNLDKIIITNDNTAGFGGAAFGQGGYEFRTFGPEGPAATDGSASREACNICNAMYGQEITDGPNQCSCKTDSADGVANGLPGLAVGSAFNCTGVIESTNMLLTDLFHDFDPLRSTQEGVKYFVNQLDPEIDQLGVVAFDDAIVDRVKLQCLRYEQVNGAQGQSACFDPAVDHPERLAVGGTGPITFARAILAVEDFTPEGSTDISEGMETGLQELGLSVGGETIGHDCNPGDDTQACDRQGAAQRVLILMTDGTPNQNVTGACRDDAEMVHWRGVIGTDEDPYNCAMYFAREAAANNVALYTIGLGSGVDPFLLTAVAEGEVTLPNPAEPCDPVTNSNGHPCGDDGFYFEPYCGRYFPAATPGVFEQILDDARSCGFPVIVPPPPPPTPHISAQNPNLPQSELLIVDLSNYDPGNAYDIYLEDPGGILYRICTNVVVGVTGNLTITCPLLNVPIGPDFATTGDVPVGNGYTLFSALAGTTNVDKVSWGSSVNVIPGSNPLIAVDGHTPPDTTVWAAGETVPVQLLFHDAAGNDYDVKLFNPDKSLQWDIALNHSGLGTDVIDWVVPNIGDDVCEAVGSDDCIINSFVAGTSTPVATTSVRINFPEITMSPPSNGLAYARGEIVYIHLKTHTPFRVYNTRIFPDGNPAGWVAGPTSTDTNLVGDTTSPILWVIPDDCGGGAGFPDGMYQISSHSTNSLSPGTLIALSEEFEVFTTPDPILTVDGGTTWPAGSTITIRVLRHTANTAHYLAFDGVRIPTGALDDTFLTDSCGDAVISFTIPPATAEGTYAITSFDNSTNTEQASVDINVLMGPTISVVEGSVVMPDQTITIEGTHHIPNTAYAIYYANKFLQNIITDATGVFSFTYDLSTLPTSPPPDLTDVNNLGIPYILKSQTVVAPITDVATTTLTLKAPIQVPSDLYFPVIMKQ